MVMDNVRRWYGARSEKRVRYAYSISFFIFLFAPAATGVVTAIEVVMATRVVIAAHRYLAAGLDTALAAHSPACARTVDMAFVHHYSAGTVKEGRKRTKHSLPLEQVRCCTHLDLRVEPSR